MTIVECKCIQLLLANVGMLRVRSFVWLSLHILFYLDKEDPDVSSEAITAAIDFVELCCQQTAYLAGRGDISEELRLQKGIRSFACKFLLAIHV